MSEKRYRHFPQSCVACKFVTPTGMCEKLFDLDKFLKSRGNPFRIAYTKRKKECPLSKNELLSLDALKGGEE